MTSWIMKVIRTILTPKFIGIVGVFYTVALITVCFLKFEDLEKVNFSYADKVFHALTYFVLTLIWFFQYYTSKKVKDINLSKLLLLITVLLIFGMVIEILQLVLTDYRSFDWIDFLADAVGIFSAAILLVLTKTRLKEFKSQILNTRYR